MNKPSQKTLGLIIANEFCERFCYYGFRALLFQFLRDVYLENEHAAVKTVHLFNFLCYIFTFMGGILSDNILGRFNTIFYLSIVYLIGTVCTTLSSAFLNKSLLYFGLICIAIGTGGIKPCVSTFGGDQFARDDLNGIKKFFVLFYFAINFGSLISIFTSPMIANMPCLGKDTCYPAAFGLPALLLAVSCVLFVLGSNLYIKKKPNPKILSKLTNCVKIYFAHFNSDQVKSNAIVQAEIAEKHGMSFYLDIVKMLKVLKVFALVPIFWMLYDQQTTTWIEQGNKMKKVIPMYFTTVSILPSQMQALNGVLILIFIPIFVRIVYPSLDKMNIRLNSLHRMGLGIIFMSLSFFNAATIQYFISRDIHILWQIPQYVLLTIGEVFLSMTGIEFVYSQSPHDMKGMVLSFWLMAVAVGNIYVVFFTSLDLVHWLSIKNKEVFNFLVYGMFGIVASFYFLRQSNTFKHTQ